MVRDREPKILQNPTGESYGYENEYDEDNENLTNDIVP